MSIYGNPWEEARIEKEQSNLWLLSQFKQLEFIAQIQEMFAKPYEKPLSLEEYMKEIDKFLINWFQKNKLTYQGKLKRNLINEYRKHFEQSYRSELRSCDIAEICNSIGNPEQ